MALCNMQLVYQTYSVILKVFNDWLDNTKVQNSVFLIRHFLKVKK